MSTDRPERLERLAAEYVKANVIGSGPIAEEIRHIVRQSYKSGYRARDEDVAALVKTTDEIFNSIGQDALQMDYEPGHLDPAQAVKSLELTIKLQKKWFTEWREALARFRGESK